MLKNKYNRIFLVEPNLKNSFGHVAEFPFSIQKLLRFYSIDAYIICNKSVDEGLLDGQTNVYPLISMTCFENLSDNGKTYEDDLGVMNTKFKLTDSDLLINLTSYTNEISGVRRFFGKKKRGLSTFAIWIHQLFPPTKEFYETTRYGFRIRTEERLKNVLNREINAKVHIFTTPCFALQKELFRIADKKVGVLPLPYDYPQRSSAPQKDSENTPLTFGFLGDGRYEKGLLTIFRYIANYKDKTHRYIIQDIFPRGYSEEEQKKYEFLKTKISREYPNVFFVNKPLGTLEYRNLLGEIDVCLLPYHPASYDKRVSGVFVEAVINGKPIIVSSNTWMAEEIDKYDCGCVFGYSDNENLILQNFAKAIRNIDNNYSKFLKKSIRFGKIYKEIHNPENFINSLMEVIN